MDTIENRFPRRSVARSATSTARMSSSSRCRGQGFLCLFEVQPYRYLFASCNNCGYTEIYNLDTLEGKDDLGNLFDILFMD